jgi:hypothetical protein
LSADFAVFDCFGCLLCLLFLFQVLEAALENTLRTFPGIAFERPKKQQQQKQQEEPAGPA